MAFAFPLLLQFRIFLAAAHPSTTACGAGSSRHWEINVRLTGRFLVFRPRARKFRGPAKPETKPRLCDIQAKHM
ncbi:hypothetical protein NKI59_02485 [Mesorhizobium sp. M0598]|uniref:hypothetical protein n=1 Tax=Mesorhizobium sp. M0598 TaxID=2956968 RepID=UPI00333BCF5A